MSSICRVSFNVYLRYGLINRNGGHVNGAITLSVTAFDRKHDITMIHNTACLTETRTHPSREHDKDVKFMGLNNLVDGQFS